MAHFTIIKIHNNVRPALNIVSVVVKPNVFNVQIISLCPLTKKIVNAPKK